MNFLEAHKIVSSFPGGEELGFLLATSGTAVPFDIYLKAAAAKLGRTIHVRTIPFNTLAQTLHGPPIPEETEIFLLMPWDFAPETDWRSGLPAREVDFNKLRHRADLTAQLLRE